MIVLAFHKSCLQTLTLKELKILIKTHFGDRLDDKQSIESNLAAWEKSLAKTLSRHKDVFVMSKAEFALSE